MVAQHREVGRQVAQLLRVGVVVLAGVQGNRHPGETAELARPQARRAYDELARDVARVGFNARHRAVRGTNAGDLHVLDALHPAPAGALHVGAHHVDGTGHPVDVEPCSPEEVVGAYQRVQVSDLLGGHDLDSPQPEGVVRVGQPPELRKAVPRVRDGEAADLAEPGGLAGLGLQLAQQVAGVGAELRVCIACPRGADEAGGVPARTGCELPAFEEDDVGPPELREVIRDARSRHAAADHDRAGALGQGNAHCGLPPVRIPGRVPGGCVVPGDRAPYFVIFCSLPCGFVRRAAAASVRSLGTPFVRPPVVRAGACQVGAVVRTGLPAESADCPLRTRRCARRVARLFSSASLADGFATRQVRRLDRRNRSSLNLQGPSAAGDTM